MNFLHHEVVSRLFCIIILTSREQAYVYKNTLYEAVKFREIYYD